MAEGSSPFTPPNTPPGWEVRLQQMEARLAQREADAESMLERMHTLLDVQANMYYKQLARTELLMQKQLEDQAAAHQKQLEQMDRIITQQVTMQQAIVAAAAHAEAARSTSGAPRGSPLGLIVEHRVFAHADPARGRNSESGLATTKIGNRLASQFPIVT